MSPKPRFAVLIYRGARAGISPSTLSQSKRRKDFEKKKKEEEDWLLWLRYNPKPDNRAKHWWLPNKIFKIHVNDTVNNTVGYHHSTHLLKKLHWLPFSERIKYKVACMCFHAINGSGPTYLSSLFFGFPHAQNPTIQTQDSRLSNFHLLWTLCFEFTPTRHQAMLNSSSF